MSLHSKKIHCHIIYNNPTDRRDWLDKCVKSLQHREVAIIVHHYKESGLVRLRRSEILSRHDQSKWIMFADPDDYALQPGYDQYIDFLLSTPENVAWPSEVIIDENEPELTVYSSKPHHLVALRSVWAVPYHPSRHYYTHAIAAGVHFPKVAYCWIRHSGATLGIDRSLLATDK